MRNLQLYNTIFAGGKTGYPTAGLQVIIYIQTYEDGGTTYLRTSTGVGIPLVSGTGLDAIWDFSVLNDPRLDKSNATYWGTSLNAWFYYDAGNPYHAKLKDFHYRYFQDQMESDNNYCFAQLNYINEELQSVNSVLIYSSEQIDSDLNRLLNYSKVFTFNSNYYYLQEFSGIALYQNDFDIIYYPNLNYTTQSNDIISASKDLNNINDLEQSVSYRKPTLVNNKAFILENKQSIILNSSYQSNFDIGINDLYIITGLRASKYQQETQSVFFFCGGSSDNVGGFHLWTLNSLTLSPQYWFTISAGDGSARKYIYGSLTTDLFDDNFHIVEIILDRNVGTTIKIDGIIQTGLTDITYEAVSYNIISEIRFQLNTSSSANGQGNNLFTCFALKKSLPTETQQQNYRNAIQSPYDDWRLNTHILFPTAGLSIPIIENESVTMYGDALCNVPIENNLSVDYNGLGVKSGNNLTLNVSSQTTYLDIYIKNINELISHQTTRINSIAKINTGTKKILSIGDSTMSAGARDMYIKLRSIFDGMTLNALGTQGLTDYKHEGYSGMTYYWFVTNELSPFVKSGSLDISSYFTDNSIDTPDIVYMRCGINDIFGYADTNITRSEMISIKDNIKTLVDGFLAYDANLKIIIALPSICENTGDGWNVNYPTYPYQDTYIEIMHYLWQEIINTFFNGVYNARVDVSFGAMFLDRNDGYPKTDGVHTNGVHPSSEGYKMLASGDAGTFNKLF